MRRALGLLALVAGGVFAFDLWTKRWATSHLQYREPIELLGEWVRLTYTRNSGVAFGLGAGVRFPYYLFSVAAAIIIIAMFLRGRARTRPRQIALSLILGGAIGNLVDRLASGEVVDFIEVGWSRWHWPVFNVADSAVTVGVILFALTWQHTPETGAASAADAAPEAAASTPPDEPSAGSFGPGAQHGGATGSLPGGGASGPLA